MRRKGYKKFFVILLSFMFIFSSVAMAYADTFYVGKVGFDMDRMLNEADYMAKFQQYYAAHASDDIIVEMAGMTFDADAYLNAPEGTSMADFAAANPATVPSGAAVWDGVGEPGVPTVDKAALNTKITEAEALVEAEYTADSWTAMQTALTAAKAVAADAEATQAQVDAAATVLDEAITALVVKPVVDKAALNAKIAEAEALVEAEYTADSWTAMQTALTAAKAVAADAEATQAQVDAAKADLDAAVTALVKKLAVVSVSAINLATEVTVANLDGATDVLANNRIWVTFNEALKTDTVNANTVKLINATTSAPVATAAPTLRASNKTIVIAPIAANCFPVNTQLKVVLKSGIANTDSSKALEQDVTAATFTTSSQAVLVNAQDNGGTNLAYGGNNTLVANAQNIDLIFSSDIDPTSATNANVRMKNITDSGVDYEAITLAVRTAPNANTLRLTIGNASGLTAGKTYEVTFTGLRTTNGTPVENGNFRFVANGTVPAINGLVTSNNDDIATGARIGWGKITDGTLQDGTMQAGLKFYVSFNTTLDESTVSAITLNNAATGDAVAVTRTYDNSFRRVTLTPEADLAEQTAYVIRVARSLKSSAGVAYAAATTSNTFTTLDLTRPTVTGVTGTVENVTIGQATTIAVNFSEAVGEYDVLAGAFQATPSAGNTFANNNSVRIRNLTGNVAMTNPPVLSMSADAKTLNITVTPAAGEANRTFEVSLNAQDGTNAYICDNVNATPTQRNSLAQIYTFTFTTEGADATPPVVEKAFFGNAYNYATPAVESGVKNVNAAANMYIVFNEAMGNTGADVTTTNEGGAALGSANVELHSRTVGGTWAVAAMANSRNGAAANFTRFTNASGKGYLTINNADIATDTQYRVVLTPSVTANGIEDANGNDMAATWTFEFATGGTLAWANPGTTAMGNDRTTASIAIAAGAGSGASAFQTAADMNAAGLANDSVIALGMTDGSFYFEQFANAADTTGANGQSLKANLPAGSKSVEVGATVVNMTDRSASFATLETGLSVSDPIAIRIDAAAGAAVDVSTVNTSNIKLVKVSDSSSVPYALYYRAITGVNALFVSINPSANLENNTTYEVQVSGVKDMIGNTITERSARFTTETAPVPNLAITGITPADQTTGVAVDASVTVTFNSAPTSAITRVAAAPAAAGQIAVQNVTTATYLAATDFNVTQSGSTWTITFNSFLAPASTYQVEIDNATANGTGSLLAGGLATDFVSTFQTEAVASKTPAVLSACLVDTNNNGVGDAGELVIIQFNTRANGGTCTITDVEVGNGGNLDSSTAAFNANQDGIVVTLANGGGNLAIIKGLTTIGIAIDGSPITANGVQYGVAKVTIQ